MNKELDSKIDALLQEHEPSEIMAAFIQRWACALWRERDKAENKGAVDAKLESMRAFRSTLDTAFPDAWERNGKL